MGQKHRRKVSVAQQKAAFMKYLESRLADMANFVTGATEQLMIQQGQMMTTQAGLIQYLDEQLAPGAASAIKSIVEQNIARMKAERAEKEKAANEAAEEKAKRDAQAAAAIAEHDALPPVPLALVEGAGVPDFGDKPYDPTAPVNIAAHEKAKREQTGAYAPTATCGTCGHRAAHQDGCDDPIHVPFAPAGIAPETPADAPADSPGST